MDAQCDARRLAVWTLAASTFLLTAAPVSPVPAQPSGNASAQSAAAAPSAGSSNEPLQVARYTSRQRSFEIPFQLGEGDTTSVVELYYSHAGAAWKLYERRRAGDSKFIFRAETDGAYWFTSRTIDAQNRTHPSGPLSAELLVIVDATPPEVDLQVEADQSGNVQCSWRISDPGLAPQSLKLEYEVEGQWRPIAVQLPPQQTGAGVTTMQGGVTWRPDVALQRTSVRLSILDGAGNLTQPVETLVLSGAATGSVSDNADAAADVADSAPRSAAEQAEQAVASPGAEQARSAVAWRPDAAAEPDEETTSRAAESIAVSPYYRRDSAAQGETIETPQPDATPSEAPPANATAQGSDSYRLPAPRAPAASTEGVASADGGAYRPATPAASQAVSSTAGAKPWNATAAARSEQSRYGQPPVERAAAASSSAANAPVAGPVSPPVARSASGSGGEALEVIGDLAVEPTNATTFQLDYDLESVGPAGVAKVELWITRNRGRDWERFAEDDDRQSPIDVEVPDEGLYGFRVRVTGHNGLGAEPPKSGDQADIWIAVDTTQPTAELTGAPYGQGETAGKLEIRWTASDANLAPRPITLRYSRSPSGPWTTIAASLPNDGEYLWAIEPNMPQEVYLRLEATDRAGNVGVTQLSDPVRLQPLIPKARIRGFKPVSNVRMGHQPHSAVMR